MVVMLCHSRRNVTKTIPITVISEQSAKLSLQPYVIDPVPFLPWGCLKIALWSQWKEIIISKSPKASKSSFSWFIALLPGHLVRGKKSEK